MRTPWFIGLFCCITGCSDATEAIRVDLPLVARLDESATETDFGYRVELTEARVSVRDFEFRTRGEEHRTARAGRWTDWLVPSASAHPGHLQGGEATGELRGSFVVDFFGADELGDATLLAGHYESANFTFDRADAGADGPGTSLPLDGHTFALAGSVRRDDFSASFVARIEAPLDRVLEGVPASFEVTAATRGRLALCLLVLDATDDVSLFDGIDFELLASDSGALVEIDADEGDPARTAAHDLLRRRLLTHDHYAVRLESR